VIDFNLENNGFSIPVQLGIGTFKYINSDNYISFGFNFTKRGSRYFEKTEYYQNTTKSWHLLALYYLDLSTSYHITVKWFKKYNTFFFAGFNNSILVTYPKYSYFKIDEDYYRRYNFSLFSGFSIQKHKNIRWSFLLNQSILSVIRRDYWDKIKLIDDTESPKMYPFELIISCAYVFD